MKLILPLLILTLCGCRTATPVPVLPVAAATQPDAVRPPSPPPRSVPPASDSRSRQQAQLIEALINQNDAMAARLAAMQSAPVPVSVVPVATTAAPVVTIPAPVSAPTPHPAEPVIVPNAEGIIDLAALANAGSAGEPVNPFAVRTTADAKTRELSLIVGGIILGRTPCATVNDRLIQTGDSVEGMEVDRIEANAVILRTGPHRLRLPVSTVPTRVKLSL